MFRKGLEAAAETPTAAAPDLEAFVTVAGEAAKELIRLRQRLVAAQTEHANLLQRRKSAFLDDGINLFPRIREELFHELLALDKIWDEEAANELVRRVLSELPKAQDFRNPKMKGTL